MTGGHAGRRPGTGRIAAALALVLVAVLPGHAAGLQQPRDEAPEYDRTAPADTLEQEAPFPHDDHAGLFPVCTGCHEGAESGVAGEMHPDPALCVECHDGREEDLVFWRGPTERPTTLRYGHREHAREVEDEGRRQEPISCTGCHTPRDTGPMAVDRAVSGRCFDCHAHEADDHYVDGECSTCHRPLAETGLPRGRIAGLPTPASHDRPDFLARVHGERARESLPRCSTCHTRESCTSCHVEAGKLETVTEMPRAPAEMEIPALEARYNTPESHTDEDFLEVHGRDLEPAECSTCHTRESCTSCHAEGEVASVAELPSARQVSAPGASVERREPDSHESPWFVDDHEALAAAGGGSCQGCHTESWCTDCHDEERQPGYHPPNFAQQHSSRAFGQEMECANCHDTSVFCRDCHAQLGMGAQGRRGRDFHDRQPAWLLRHGQAARQALESCASCHQQRDCLQCHSETGAFQVSPHGPGFDARRLFDRNPQICFACHTSDPLEGSR